LHAMFSTPCSHLQSCLQSHSISGTTGRNMSAMAGVVFGIIFGCFLMIWVGVVVLQKRQRRRALLAQGVVVQQEVPPPYVDTRTHVHARTHTHTHTHTHAHAHTHTHTQTHTNKHTNTHNPKPTHTHTHTHQPYHVLVTHKRVRVHVCVRGALQGTLTSPPLT
jgi:hypothetical protein